MNIQIKRFFRIGIFILSSTVIMGGYQNCAQMKNSKDFETNMLSSIEKKRDSEQVNPIPTLNQIGVASAKLSAQTVEAGQSFTMTQNWTGGPSKFPLKVFVHFLDAKGNLAFQDNYFPLMSTVTWSTTQSEARSFMVPPTAAGTYSIVTGLYDETYGPREPLFYSTGVVDIGEARYRVATIMVTPKSSAAQPTNPSAPNLPTVPANPKPIIYSGSITISKGGTYSGNWESLDPKIPAVNVKTNEPVIIENCNVRSRGHLFQVAWGGAKVTIQNCKGLGLNPNVLNSFHGRFLNSESFDSLNVRNNTMVKTGGIYMYLDKRSATSKILITQNDSLNIEGRRSDGKDGYLKAFYPLQFAQFNRINNHPDIEISWNKVVNIARESYVEDNINLYNTSGTRDHPIRVNNNLIDGAFGGTDPSETYSGGGIMLGDGNCADGNVIVENNTVLETSNYGIAVAGGNYQKISNNTVLGVGKLADGTYLDADSDAGIYVRDYCGSAQHDPKTVFATGNTIGWGTPSPAKPNDRWNESANPAAVLLANVSNMIIADGPINPALLVNARNAWLAKAAGRQIGSK